MAKPSYPRARRLAETIRRLAGEWLEAELADQPGPLVTVTDVRVTGDLHHARVFYTVLGDDVEKCQQERQPGLVEREEGQDDEELEVRLDGPTRHVDHDGGADDQADGRGC